MFYVYARNPDGSRQEKYLSAFVTRKEAVFWCKVNQVSRLPDGEWEDDYEIEELP